MKHSRLIFACVAVLAMQFQPVHGQGNFVFFSGSWEMFPDSGVDDVTNRPNLSGVETRLGNFKFHIAYPLAGSKDSESVIIGKLSYEQLEFQFNSDSLPRYQPSRLHEFAAEVSWRTRIGADWSLTTMIKPNIASDFEDIDGFLSGNTALNLDAGLIFSRQLGNVSGFGFGARFTTDFGEPLVLPALIYRNSGSTFRIDALLPKHIELMYVPGPSVELGLAGRVSGNHYRIGEESTIRNGTSVENGRIKYSVITLGPALRFGLSQSVFLGIEGGVALMRRFQVFDSEDDEIDTLDMERSFTLRAGLQVRR